MQRWTQKEYQAFRTDWLLQRMRHTWSDNAPCTCTLCGAKFSATNSRRRCPKRKTPNRWRLHFERAVRRAQYDRQKPIVRDATWIYAQLQEIRRDVQYWNRLDQRFEDPRYWKYHRLARRYRRLLREWWQLPAREVQSLIMSDQPRSIDTFGANWTRRRNRLAQQVRTTQARVIRDGTCTYTFYADAQWKGLPLFTEEGEIV